MAKQHRSGTDLEAESNQSEERTENTLLLETEEKLNSKDKDKKSNKKVLRIKWQKKQKHLIKKEKILILENTNKDRKTSNKRLQEKKCLKIKIN